MDISKVIEQLGYKQNEAKVYLATLAAGESTVSDIALKVKIPRSSTQVILNKLHKNGLVNFYVRKRYKYWVAESPEKLMEAIKEKENILASAMKEITSLKRKQGTKPMVKVFVGSDEIKLIHESMIQAKRSISAIIPWELWINLLGQDYLNDFIILRAKHFLKMRLLLPKTSNSIKLKENDMKEFRHIKFLPGSLPIEDALFIFGDSVAIISLNESQPTGVVIDDAFTARTMNTFFEHFWEHGSE